MEEIIVTNDFIKSFPDCWKFFSDKTILGITRKTDQYTGLLVTESE